MASAWPCNAFPSKLTATWAVEHRSSVGSPRSRGARPPRAMALPEKTGESSIMTWPARALIAIILPLCLLVGVGAGAAAAPVPPQLIQLRDLRRGYVQTVSRIYGSDAAIARAHIAWRLLLDQG